MKTASRRAIAAIAAAFLFVLALVPGAVAGPGISGPLGLSLPTPSCGTFTTGALSLNKSCSSVVPGSFSEGPFSALTFRLAPGVTPVEGATQTIRIPAGAVTAVNTTALAGLNARGDSPDVTQDGELVIGFNGGRAWGSYRNVGVADVVAPTIVSLYCDQVDTPSTVTLTFSESVVIPATTGWTWTSSGGQTLSTVSLSPSSLNVATLNLSGPLLGSETVSLAISSANTVQDISGNKLAATSVPVSFLTRANQMAGNTLDWMSSASSEVSLSGSNVLAAIDRGPLGYQINGAGVGHYPTWTTDCGTGDHTPCVTTTGVAASEQYLTITAATLGSLPWDGQSDETMILLVKTATPPTTYDGIWSLDDSGGNQGAFYQRDNLNISAFTMANGHPSFNTTNLGDHALHLVIIYRHGSVWGVRVDLGTAVESAVVAPYPTTGALAMYFGLWHLGGSIIAGSNMSLQAAIAFSGYVSPANQTVVRNLLKTNWFPSCP